MNKTTAIIIAIIVLLGGIYLIARTPAKNANVTNNSKAEGRVVLAVTDAAANMGQVSEINMKISRVDMHSQASGWTTASTTPHDYDLLALNATGQSKILADANVDAGTYDQVRLTIDSVDVEVKNSSTSHEATVPANQVVLNTTVNVSEGSTSTVTFDFIADKSLFTTTNGTYVFAPVVKTESRSNTGVTLNADGVVTIGGGTVDSNTSFGMDVDGSVKANFELNSNQKLDIKDNAIIKLDTILK